MQLPMNNSNFAETTKTLPMFNLDFEKIDFEV